jgi:hypothetical protein
LRDELNDKTFATRVAGYSAAVVAAHGLSMTLLGAIKSEASLSLLHLVAELNLELSFADAAVLDHARHFGAPIDAP